VSKSFIKTIRSQRNVPAKIGQIVTYAGRPYRIAWTTDAGHLVLRDQIIVHPTDPALDYTAKNLTFPADSFAKMIKGLQEIADMQNQLCPVDEGFCSGASKAADIATDILNSIYGTK